MPQWDRRSWTQCLNSPDSACIHAVRSAIRGNFSRLFFLARGPRPWFSLALHGSLISLWVPTASSSLNSVTSRSCYRCSPLRSCILRHRCLNPCSRYFPRSSSLSASAACLHCCIFLIHHTCHELIWSMSSGVTLSRGIYVLG